MTILGSLVVREARRLAAIDITSLFDTHRQAADVGGIGVFLVFFVVNAAVITACVLIVKRPFVPITDARRALFITIFVRHRRKTVEFVSETALSVERMRLYRLLGLLPRTL